MVFLIKEKFDFYYDRKIIKNSMNARYVKIG